MKNVCSECAGTKIWIQGNNGFKKMMPGRTTLPLYCKDCGHEWEAPWDGSAYLSVFLGIILLMTGVVVFAQLTDHGPDRGLFQALGFVFGVGGMGLLAYGATGVQNLNKNGSDARKECPDCAEEIKAAARKCKHCGYRFDESADPLR